MIVDNIVMCRGVTNEVAGRVRARSVVMHAVGAEDGVV